MSFRTAYAAVMSPDGLMGTLRAAIPIAWRTNRALCTVTVVMSLIAAQVAPLLVLLTGAVVNEIPKALQNAEAAEAGLRFWLLTGGALGAVLGISGALRRYARDRLRDEIQLRVNRDVVGHAASLDLETREALPMQNALGRASLNPGLTVLNITVGTVSCIAALVQSGGLLLVLLWIEPVWSMFLGLLAIPHLVAQWFLSQSRHRHQRARTTSLRRTIYYRNLLTTHRHFAAIQALCLAPWLLDRFDEANEEVLHTSRRIYRQQAAGNIIAGLLTLVVVVSLLTVVGKAAVLGEITTGAFIAFWIAAWRLQSSLARLADAFAGIFRAHFEFGNLREFLELQSAHRPGSRKPGKLRGHLVGHELTYRYPESEQPAVDRVSLEIRAGETVALVGPNGAGKSTLARLLANLYQPSHGTLLVDGLPMSELEAQSLYQQLAYLPQEVFPLEATALENIAVGDMRRLADRPELVREIARRSDVDEFISRLPQGYDTHLGRVFGESTLSGGQWQRLAVARSLASNPAIVILDEPCASMDPSAEDRFLNSFERQLASRTVVLISHRFSMLRIVDRILVMDNGRIVEEGGHDELMRSGGLYASLYRSSQSRFSPQSSTGNADAA